MSIATKTGDNGTTALMYGHRVTKTDLRVEAYGSVDELNSSLGLLRAQATEAPLVTEPILAIQRELVILMGELAVTEDDQERYQKGGFKFVTGEMVDALTGLIEHLEKTEKLSFDGWATPGANLASAAADVARTVCRRAERRVIELRENGATVNSQIIRYLNRLSDLCWLYARWLENPSKPISNPEKQNN